MSILSPEQFVKGLLTVGLTVVSATPKAGKIWLVHECTIGVATGRNALGVLPCQQAEVLCLFLEDRAAGDPAGTQPARRGGRYPGLTYCYVGSQWTLNASGDGSTGTRPAA